MSRDTSRIERFMASMRDRETDGLQNLSLPPGANPDSPSEPVPVDPTDLLDSNALAKVGKLELIANTVVDGVMSGKHRSTHKGGCSEFSEHRPYTPGDDIRTIDWRIFAKRDRYYVKQYDDETNLHAWMVVDASGSMGFGLSSPTKFDYARVACACLSRMLLRQRDSIGLMMQVGRQQHVVPPRPQANHFLSLCDTLRRASPGGKASVARQLHRLTGQLKRRGLICVFSDCFGDVDSLLAAIQQLRLRGHDVIVFQVLAPEEVAFNFRRQAIFQDLEMPSQRLNVSPGGVRRRYLEKFRRFMKELSERMVRIDCDLVTLQTDQDLGDALAFYLRRRAATVRQRRPVTA